MKISIDLDGVVSDFTHAATRVINTIWPGRIPEGYEPTDWHWTDHMKKEDWGPVFKLIKTIDNFWETQKPYDANMTALRHFLLTEENQEVYYVTSRAQTTGRPLTLQCESWLMSNWIWPEKNYHAVLPIKEGIPAEAKKAMMEALGLEYSVDDYAPTVELCNTIPGHRAFVLDRPWNRSYTHLPRVYSLAEYFQEVKLGRAN